MNKPTNAQQTNVASAVYGGSKPHYLILDGLRGVAALIVICFHLFEAYAINPVEQSVNHGYLAVDFFFMLSGFVIGYSYDHRIDTVSSSNFLLRRLIRLQPMVLVGAILGAVMFYFQGCEMWNVGSVGLSSLFGTTLLNCFLIPSTMSMDIRGWGEMFPLNGPCWSLFFEYIAYVLYAFIFRKVSTRVLWWIVPLFAVGLAYAAFQGDYCNLGWGWALTKENFIGGMFRLLFSFTAGLFISRTYHPGIIKHPFVIGSIVLVVLTFMPNVGGHEYNWMNGIYDVFCITCAFPIVMCIGASATAISDRTKRIVTWLGDLSYPVYIVHYPLVYTYYAWVKNNELPFSSAYPAAIAVVVVSIVLAQLCFRYYDAPLRKYLSNRFVK